MQAVASSPRMAVSPVAVVRLPARNVPAPVGCQMSCTDVGAVAAAVLMCAIAAGAGAAAVTVAVNRAWMLSRKALAAAVSSTAATPAVLNHRAASSAVPRKSEAPYRVLANSTTSGSVPRIGNSTSSTLYIVADGWNGMLPSAS